MKRMLGYRLACINKLIALIKVVLILKLADIISGKKLRLPVAELEARAQVWKNAHPNLETATLEADDAVEYRAVVEAMEKLRAAIPTIQLSGS
jgi:biopolymer transport protein ExbD